VSAPFFDTATRVEALTARWQVWRNTPFRQRHCAPGVGVDCLPLAWDLYHAAGLCGPVDLTRIPAYAVDWSANNDTSILEPLLLEWLVDEGVPTARVPVISATRPGDFLLMKPGGPERAIHHVGVVLPARKFAHVLAPMVARQDHLSHPRFSGYFAYALRPLETN